MKEIRDGGVATKTTPGELYSLLEKQPDGPKSDAGPLLTNGYANLFEMDRRERGGSLGAARTGATTTAAGTCVPATRRTRISGAMSARSSPAILVCPRPLSPFDPWTLCPFDPRIFFGSGGGLFHIVIE